MIEINYLEELISRKRVLRVNSSFYWYDMVDAGIKLEEYRAIHWMSRILYPQARFMFEFALLKQRSTLIPAFHVKPVIIEIVRGYTSTVQHFAVEQVRWGQPRPEWSGKTITTECFGFKLGERLCLT